jgi:hypothetical protein
MLQAPHAKGVIMKKQLAISLALSLGLLASNAAMADDTLLGALLGGGAGVLVGSSLGGRDGAIIGGALGAAAGAAIASQNDRPRSHYAPPAYARYEAPAAYYPAPVHYAPQGYYPQNVRYVRGERWYGDHRAPRDEHRH